MRTSWRDFAAAPADFRGPLRLGLPSNSPAKGCGWASSPGLSCGRGRVAFEAGIAGVMPQPRGAALILDEMFPSALAAALILEGHDVVAVCERQELRALSDSELFEWAAN